MLEVASAARPYTVSVGNATRPPARRHAAASAIASGLAVAKRVILRLSAISPHGSHCARTRLYISSFVPAAATDMLNAGTRWAATRSGPRARDREEPRD